MALPVTDAFRRDYRSELETVKSFLSKAKGRAVTDQSYLAASQAELEKRQSGHDDGDVEMDEEEMDEDDDEEEEGVLKPKKTGLKYVDQMQRVADRVQSRFMVDLDDLATMHRHSSGSADDQDYGELLTHLVGNASRYVDLFCSAIDELLPDPTDPVDLQARHDVLDVIMHQRREKSRANQELGEMTFPPLLTRRYNLFFQPLRNTPLLSVRQVKGVHLGSLLTVRGIVTRVSEVKPLLLVNAYSCDSCGAEVFQDVDGRSVNPLVECPGEECVRNGTRGKLVMQTRACKFEPFQEVKIQELADQVPVGHIPRSMTLHLYGPNCRLLSPGDTIHASGIFLPTPYTGFRGLRAGLLTDTYLEVHHVVHLRQSYDRLELTPEVEAAIAQLKRDPSLYAKLATSIAPEIYGHLDVKKALLLLLVGGVTKTMGDGLKIRGDVNVCLMGDPGVAKSQLLKYISKVAPRGVYTTGRGSSGVGLTAAVMRDPVTDEMVLEGGALVLADNGICCIDEFDKMDESDRTAIHEVMEQQTISISKAGITTTLNARTSILAAANPLYGRYNPKISPVDNINLPAALLSRFDVMFLILDAPTRESDERLAQHVTQVHMTGQHPPLEHDPVEPVLMRHYIALARQKRPVVPKHVSDYIVQAYVQLRKQHKEDEKEGKTFTYTSARTLLGVIRLSQALARLRFSETVEVPDVDEGLRLMEASKASLEVDDDDDVDGATGVRRDTTDMSKIFRIVRDMMAANRKGPKKLGRRTGRGRSTIAMDVDEDDDDDGEEDGVLQMREVRQRVFAKGFTEERLLDCVVEYEGLGIWARENNDTLLRFIDADADV